MGKYCKMNFKWISMSLFKNFLFIIKSFSKIFSLAILI